MKKSELNLLEQKVLNDLKYRHEYDKDNVASGLLLQHVRESRLHAAQIDIERQRAENEFLDIDEDDE